MTISTGKTVPVLIMKSIGCTSAHSAICSATGNCSQGLPVPQSPMAMKVTWSSEIWNLKYGNIFPQIMCATDTLE